MHADQERDVKLGQERRRLSGGGCGPAPPIRDSPDASADGGARGSVSQDQGGGAFARSPDAGLPESTFPIDDPNGLGAQGRCTSRPECSAAACLRGPLTLEVERRSELFQDRFRVEAADLHLYQTAPGNEIPSAGKDQVLTLR